MAFPERRGLVALLGLRRTGTIAAVLCPPSLRWRATELARTGSAPSLPAAQAQTGRANGALPYAPGIPGSSRCPDSAAPKAPPSLSRGAGPQFSLASCRDGVCPFADPDAGPSIRCTGISDIGRLRPD